ncbi:MAG: transketolase [Chlorobi bacterium]|nr:transketolase [Chlorobiota bacterium]MCI0715051.1 transketolase [Chlorobiota bacterium]
MNYEELLKELVLNDERIMVLTSENRAAIRNLPEQIGDRFIDVGISEQTMIGIAAGLALRGRIPVAHALATFLTMRAFEFIRTDVGIANLPVKLVGAVPGFLSEANGPTHQAIEDVSLMRGIPNVNVFCPADEEDMLIGLREVLLSGSPFYIRFNNLKSAVKHNLDFVIGKAEVISCGNDITILTFGMLLRQAYEAMIILESKGLSVRLINLRTLKPIDEEVIINAAEETSLIVTLEDHFITGGLYSILGEIFLKNNLTNNVLPIALDNKWFKPALLQDILNYEGFTGPQIAERIINHFQTKTDTIKIKSLI